MKKENDITARRCKDKEFIKRCLAEVWDTIAEDGAKLEDADPDLNDYWIQIEVNGEKAGVYYVHYWNASTMMIHANILPKYRKNNTRKMAAALFMWLTEYTPENVVKFMAMIPKCYHNVIDYTKKTGFKQEGILRETYKHHGEIHDLYVFGLTKQEMRECLQEHR